MVMAKITREEAEQIVELQLDYKESIYDDNTTTVSHYGRVEIDILLDNIYGVDGVEILGHEGAWLDDKDCR